MAEIVGYFVSNGRMLTGIKHAGQTGGIAENEPIRIMTQATNQPQSWKYFICSMSGEEFLVDPKEFMWTGRVYNPVRSDHPQLAFLRSTMTPISWLEKPV